MKKYLISILAVLWVLHLYAFYPTHTPKVNQRPPEIPLFIYTIPQTLLLAEGLHELTGPSLDTTINLIRAIPELIGTTVVDENNSTSTLTLDTISLEMYHPPLQEHEIYQGFVFNLRQIIDGELTTVGIVQVETIP